MTLLLLLRCHAYSVAPVKGYSTAIDAAADGSTASDAAARGASSSDAAAYGSTASDA